eukprot:4019322-Pleurochrysis_carterae.AAC.2
MKSCRAVPAPCALRRSGADYDARSVLGAARRRGAAARPRPAQSHRSPPSPPSRPVSLLRRASEELLTDIMGKKLPDKPKQLNVGLSYHEAMCMHAPPGRATAADSHIETPERASLVWAGLHRSSLLDSCAFVPAREAKRVSRSSALLSCMPSTTISAICTQQSQHERTSKSLFERLRTADLSL